MPQSYDCNSVQIKLTHRLYDHWVQEPSAGLLFVLLYSVKYKSALLNMILDLCLVMDRLLLLFLLAKCAL